MVKITPHNFSHEVFTYSYLYKIAEYSYNLYLNGDHSNFENYHHRVISLLFFAFSLEAFLNHVGEKILNNWDQIENGMNSTAKLLLIGIKLNENIDFSSRPYKTYKELFYLRNFLVHGKTEKIISTIGRDKFQPVKWQRIISSLSLDNVIKDTKIIMENFHKSANLDTELFSLGKYEGRLAIMEINKEG